MNSLIKLFSGRNARIVCLVIAILNRSLMVYHYSEFVNYDEKMQLSYAYNFMHGDGLSIKKYFSETPDTPVYVHTQRWPPGYSLAIIPFLSAFQNNEFLATTTLDIIAAILFVFLVQYLCKLLSVSPAITNIAILISGCFQYYTFIQSYSSDHPALVSLLAGVIVSIRLVNNPKRLSLVGCLFISILFFLPFFFRYMYLPTSIVLPLTLVCFSYINKNSVLRRNGMILFLLSFILTSTLLIWTKLYSGDYAYIVETEKGFFPGQLLYSYPFIPAVFLNIEFVTSIIGTTVNKNYDSVMHFMDLINLFLLLILIYGAYLVLQKKQLKKYTDKFQFFLIAGILLSASIILLLYYLSITNKSQGFWNYNTEGRYHIFPVVFLQLLFIIRSPQGALVAKNIFSKYFISVLFILLFLGSFLGVMSTIKNLRAGNEENPFPTKRYLSYRHLMKVFNEVNKKYPDREVIVTSPNEYFLCAANNAGYKAIYDFDSINFKQPKVSKRSVLITVVNDDDTSYMSKYVLEKKPLKFAYEQFISFFAEEIDPELLK